MDFKEQDPIDILRSLEESASLLDVLIQVEDFIDSADCYAFHGWAKGFIAAGPQVERYWVKVILEFPYKEMPDPAAGMRLVKYGAKIFYEEAEREVEMKERIPNMANGETDDTKAPMASSETKPIWLLHLYIPRRYFNDIASETLPIGDDELDMEDVSDAMDQGIEDGEDAVVDENGEAAGAGADMGGDVGGDLDDLFQTF